MSRCLKFEKSQKLQKIRCHSEFFFLKAPKIKIFVFLNCLCFFKLLLPFFFLFLQACKEVWSVTNHLGPHGRKRARLVLENFEVWREKAYKKWSAYPLLLLRHEASLTLTLIQNV